MNLMVGYGCGCRAQLRSTWIRRASEDARSVVGIVECDASEHADWAVGRVWSAFKAGLVDVRFRSMGDTHT